MQALYIDPRGPYPKLLGQENCWDEARDAKLYCGEGPVIAHPPCGPWSKLRHLCTRQDPECGKVGVGQVRRAGGVLEHPAHSLLWRRFGMPGPEGATDEWGGRTYAVDQCDWGHCCRKPTWLYVVRVDQEYVMRRLAERRSTGVPTHCVCTGPRQKVRLPVASKRKKTLTPEPFASLLIDIASRVR
jgi:hypothetical protein